MRRFYLFYKALSRKVPKYIYELILLLRQLYRSTNSFTVFSCRTEYFKNSFLPCLKNAWNKLDPKICKFTSYLSFRNALNFFRPSGNKIFSIHDQVDIKLLARLRLGFIRSSLKPQCVFFLRYQFYNVVTANLMSNLMNVGSSLPTGNDQKFLDILLCSNRKINTNTSQNILICTLKFITDSHFSKLLAFF